MPFVGGMVRWRLCCDAKELFADRALLVGLAELVWSPVALFSGRLRAFWWLHFCLFLPDGNLKEFVFIAVEDIGLSK